MWNAFDVLVALLVRRLFWATNSTMGVDGRDVTIMGSMGGHGHGHTTTDDDRRCSGRGS